MRQRSNRLEDAQEKAVGDFVVGAYDHSPPRKDCGSEHPLEALQSNGSPVEQNTLIGRERQPDWRPSRL